MGSEIFTVIVIFLGHYIFTNLFIGVLIAVRITGRGGNKEALLFLIIEYSFDYDKVQSSKDDREKGTHPGNYNNNSNNDNNNSNNDNNNSNNDNNNGDDNS